MAKTKQVEETEEVKEEVVIPNPQEQMIRQRDEYLALLKLLQDEGIVNIGVLENKIASLNKAIG
jgi:hypothetical protein